MLRPINLGDWRGAICNADQIIERILSIWNCWSMGARSFRGNAPLRELADDSQLLKRAVDGKYIFAKLLPIDRAYRLMGKNVPCTPDEMKGRAVGEIPIIRQEIDTPLQVSAVGLFGNGEPISVAPAAQRLVEDRNSLDVE